MRELVRRGHELTTHAKTHPNMLKRAGERAEAISVVSHDIAPNANGISMKTAWLDRLLREAGEAGVIIRGLR